MITAKLKTILTNSGCTFVVYESDKLANIITDQADQNKIVGIIFQLNSMRLEVKANAILEHYPNLSIDIIQQVKLEDKADNNEVKLQALLNICKKIILYLIGDAEFKTLTPVTVNKVFETKYDINAIGWTMTLDLTYLLNENKNPCL